jgi:ABC-type multidrug transport system fused ATPase/permease subunit
MERDPLRLVWRTAPELHAVAFGVMLLMGGLLLAAFDLVRIVVDGGASDALPRLAVDGGAANALLRIAVPWPASMGGGSLVLFEGLPLSDRKTTLWALALVPLAIGLGLALLQAMAARIGTRVVAQLRGRILDRVLAARTGGLEDAALATEFAGETVSRENGFLGSALIGVTLAGGAVALALFYLANVDPRLAFATAVLLLIGGLLGLRRLRLRGHLARTLVSESTRVRHSLGDLLRRRPALRAHGTAAFEGERLRAEWQRDHRPVEGAERRLALIQGLAGALLLLTPLAVLLLGAVLGSGSSTPGSLAAGAAAATMAALSVREITRWQRALEGAAGVLAEMARVLGSLQARDRPERPVALPHSGALVAQGVSAYDPENGSRIAGIDFTLPLPAHTVLLSDGDDGARLLTAVLAGQVEPSMGRLTYGGVDVAGAHPADRAGRIAYAGGDTVLMPGSLRDNLLYGCPKGGADLDARLASAVAVAGLDGVIHARGLAGTLDPQRESRLAAAIVEARRAVQAALRTEGLDRFVDPFDTARYNHHATLGENLLFGQPVGDTFRESHLAAHPFVRAVLEAEDLTKPLTAMGLSIASSMVEIFADIPAGHPLFERFSFFTAAERGYFEDLIERRSEPRGGRRRSESGRDRERLIGLALRYNESRHRLGLVDETLQARLVAARDAFARMLPGSLQGAIEFYDSGRLCRAASVQDNLLFGRVAEDQAGAEPAVHGVIRRVLTERGLDTEVSRIGLDRAIDPRGDDLSSAEIVAIDLVRGLVRQPDLLVVQNALNGLPAVEAEALVQRLRRYLVGRSLILSTTTLSPRMDTPPFDVLLSFRRGGLQVEHRRVDPVRERMSA